MSTLLKRRKRKRLSPFESRLLTPWNNNLLRPWRSRLFNPNLNYHSRFDDVFEDAFFAEDSLMPAMNVKEQNEGFEIEFAAPGYNKKDFEVTIEDDVLQVSAEKEMEDEQKEDDYSRKEFSYESFKRSMMLPPSVDLNQDVKASYKNGILKLKLLKRDDILDKETSKKVIEVL
ncbi:Hsp20/alpha crystallin family protein [Hwangdonia lutea]|uniref:Hsp20/alpha crystallin family protein n=1 Tax=Hwangdonia lutea TaxID=3075823 RepID=A0AA97EKU6_9FLAO|nr:Hsp20/alpha crystallin family protein [Hwangdonia sp. SCSIO 19198]WOD42967.1 Hsp20/alpha crystallin family protein [Hwangdonia sp. SCSIO 19198]